MLVHQRGTYSLRHYRLWGFTGPCGKVTRPSVTFWSMRQDGYRGMSVRLSSWFPFNATNIWYIHHLAYQIYDDGIIYIIYTYIHIYIYIIYIICRNFTTSLSKILRKTPSFSSAAFVSGQGGFACQEQATRKPRRKKRVVFPWLPWPGYGCNASQWAALAGSVAMCAPWFSSDSPIKTHLVAVKLMNWILG